MPKYDNVHNLSDIPFINDLLNIKKLARGLISIFNKNGTYIKYDARSIEDSIKRQIEAIEHYEKTIAKNILLYHNNYTPWAREIEIDNYLANLEKIKAMLVPNINIFMNYLIQDCADNYTEKGRYNEIVDIQQIINKNPTVFTPEQYRKILIDTTALIENYSKSSNKHEYEQEVLHQLKVQQLSMQAQIDKQKQVLGENGTRIEEQTAERASIETSVATLKDEQRTLSEAIKTLENQKKELTEKTQRLANPDSILRTQIKIETIFQGLSKKIDKINEDLTPKALETAQKLLSQLTLALDNYKEDPNKDLFIANCTTAIDAAKPLLEQDLGWGEYLTILLKKIVDTVFTFGQGSFFNTKKPKAVGVIEEAQSDLNEQLKSKQ